MEKYDHTTIEKKWQKRWEESGAFAAPQNPRDKKLYVLDMFPYPSGAGLHVGHVEGYTATDIYSRFKRMQGYSVLHPMGWDAFGLPAENYAIKTGIPPAQTTEAAIATFRQQIKDIGLSYDWSREIGAHTPEYYKWTQWFFLLLYKNGLAYKKKALVNWDPVDQTVLANEQVLQDGTAERSGAVVEKKELEQWFFKITDFADALVDDLEKVDWPESTKINQRNWIGRSEGAEIDFAIVGHPMSNIRVFTTRPDTLYGATYLVLAPEHPWVTLACDEQHTILENKDEVKKYIAEVKNRTDIERTAEGKEKTGVELKGVKAINPATKEEMPIWVADFVLGHYGTGAIFADAHDQRDWDFAKKYNIPLKETLEPFYVQDTEPGKLKGGMSYDHRDAIIAAVKHWSEDKYIALKWKQVAWTTFVTGGIEEGQTAEEAARMEIREETGYTNLELVSDFGKVHGLFYHVAKQVNRFAHSQALLFKLTDDSQEPVSADEQAKHQVVWLTAAELEQQLTAGTHQHTLRWVLGTQGAYTSKGILKDSGEFTGLDSDEAIPKITAKFGTLVKKYRLRDWLISRQRYWGAPIPVVYDPGGVAHPVPEEHLPWMLPTDVEFRPTGTSPLGQSKELLERTEKIFGKGWKPEIDTMDTFVCSSWYYFRFADPHNAAEFASHQAIKKWLPVDLYVGGAEHTVLHLMYARFFTKVLQKLGYIEFGEPFLKLRHQGTILAEDGSKMSKSKGNVINPDEVVERWGADSLRLYEMFMGPLEAQKPWNTNNILGVRRFLERVWLLQEKVVEVSATPETEMLLNQTIKKITGDIEALKMNTAVSALMILSNHLAELEKVPRLAYVVLLQLLAPFAPHIVYELLEIVGWQGDTLTWPVADESKIVANLVVVAVQVNGKLRSSIELGIGVTKEEALALARAEPAVANYLAQWGEVKAVYVPGKIINFVVK